VREVLITCPACHTEFPLTSTLAEPLIAATRAEFGQRLAAKDQQLAEQAEAIGEAREALATEREQLEATLHERVAALRPRIAADEGRRARQVFELELAQAAEAHAALEAVLAARTAKLEQAQAAEVEALRKGRELDDLRRELELKIAQGVEHQLASVRDQARREGEEGQALRIRERDAQIAGLQKQIALLKEKAEHGSERSHGEAAELLLEEVLRARFPSDRLEPVGKGQNGADLLQHVIGLNGEVCGALLWESKHTQRWSEGWLAKLRNDQRACGAEIAILVSTALPPGLAQFDLVDRVWVVQRNCVLPLAVALREALVAVARLRRANEHRGDKAQALYAYVSGPRFRQRLAGLVERFVELQADLQRERRAIMKGWARRETLLQGAVDDLSQLFGDVEGLAGPALPELDVLKLPKGDAAPVTMEVDDAS
jgi:hypothetical protein